ncbi:2-oxo acid dehydrogenase subunit E2 [Nitrospirillum viridazoti]|uniref:Dihydrolipoyllysine-residue acetyltransferase component of pyruvate dehydrogenase complex n=1 Tax=Nitrospirillum viridazoti CBAmc TaxID=1441467 RepID=A0A248JUF0_9PROT|nr:2-oxo acid dehydrogenase subunit E2 [Nitrospirillum amazonense]ASG22229.1 dihydrolipoamide acetyltransferase [Nitrospirillum amazonense CBAmc]TWB31006.1 pyruvate dehydrogenase E2 component (dihydrolipoamide acetyltransferase) [Nitrospirillum amazonense]
MSALLEGLAPWPETDFAAFGPVETRKLSRIQALVGAFLGRNWVAIPHVTHQDEADITELEQRRRDRNAAGGPKITIVPLLVKAMAAGLKAFPQFNASLDLANKTLVLKQYVHIGVAVDTPGGLLVPVVRDCDTKSLDTIATEIAALSEKARTKGLPMAEMSGGCMSLTSLGHIGGTGFTPIVNVPEVAILGVTRVRPVATPAPDGGVVWRQVLPLSLSYDHRVINGADAARFCRFIADRLADPALFD